MPKTPDWFGAIREIMGGLEWPASPEKAVRSSLDILSRVLKAQAAVGFLSDRTDEGMVPTAAAGSARVELFARSGWMTRQEHFSCVRNFSFCIGGRRSRATAWRAFSSSLPLWGPLRLGRPCSASPSLGGKSQRALVFDLSRDRDERARRDRALGGR